MLFGLHVPRTYLKNNTNVVTTLTGLQAFDLMYQVGCLSDPSTHTYCYLNAVHNSNPSDIYIYQLPLGLAYPNASTPTCSTCAKVVMGDYLNALQNTSTSSALGVLKSNYPSAEQDLVAGCGTDFAKSLSSAAGRPSPAMGIMTVIAFLILCLSWLGAWQCFFLSLFMAIVFGFLYFLCYIWVFRMSSIPDM